MPCRTTVIEVGQVEGGTVSISFESEEDAAQNPALFFYTLDSRYSLDCIYCLDSWDGIYSWGGVRRLPGR